MKKVVWISLLLVCAAGLFLFRGAIVERLSRFDAVQKAASGMLGIEPADLEIANSGEGYYAFSTLSEEEQLVYNQMAQCIFEHQKKATISTSKQDVADKAFQCLLSDHPEIFWTSAYELTMYRFSGMNFECVFRPDYAMTAKEVEQYQKKIEAYAQNCLAGIPETADEYEKAKYLYEYVIVNTEYDKKSKNNQNICSVFIDRASVCMGYAKAYQFLLQQLGIEAAVIAGKSGSESHAWNLVKLEGDYYYVDPTWGDPEFHETSAISASYVDYNFFGMTTKQLLLTHSLKNAFVVPECSHTKCNYFVREGLYLSAFDEQKVNLMLERHLPNHTYISICCKDSSVYKQLFDYLITNSNIYEFLKQNYINYAENEVYHTLTIFHPK